MASNIQSDCLEHIICMMGVHQKNKILSSTTVKREVNNAPHNRRVNSPPVAEGPPGGKKKKNLSSDDAIHRHLLREEDN